MNKYESRYAIQRRKLSDGMGSFETCYDLIKYDYYPNAVVERRNVEIIETFGTKKQAVKYVMDHTTLDVIA